MADSIDLRDDDRLPWLETVEPDVEEPRSNAARGIALALLGLGLIAAIVFGVLRWQQGGTGGDGTLIAAQEGDYKVRPDDPGGLKVEGEGDTAIATSAGAKAGTGKVDLRQVPEAPIANARPAQPKVAATPTGAGRNTVAQVPEPGGRLVAAAPMGPSRVAVAGMAGGGSLVQLGAFPTESAANAAWGNAAKRFGYLAPLGKSVERADVGGRTVFRLRVNAGSANQAADICGRLRVAGEGCFVTS